MDADGSNMVNLTDHPSGDRHPGWSPDGNRIIFTSSRLGYINLFIMNADGSDVTGVTSGHNPAWGPGRLK